MKIITEIRIEWYEYVSSQRSYGRSKWSIYFLALSCPLPMAILGVWQLILPQHLVSTATRYFGIYFLLIAAITTSYFLAYIVSFNIQTKIIQVGITLPEIERSSALGKKFQHLSIISAIFLVITITLSFNFNYFKI